MRQITVMQGTGAHMVRQIAATDCSAPFRLPPESTVRKPSVSPRTLFVFRTYLDF
jgi:hypothetical protein